MKEQIRVLREANVVLKQKCDKQAEEIYALKSRLEREQEKVKRKEEGTEAFSCYTFSIVSFPFCLFVRKQCSISLFSISAL